MYMLQLFDSSDDVHPVDARLLRDGLLRVGRDKGADWSIVDPQCALSRTHCEFAVADQGLTLRSLGANGMFDAATGARLPQDRTIALALPFAARLGDFRIVAIEAPHGDISGNETRTMVLTPPLGDSLDVPSDWTDKGCAAARIKPDTNGSLLEAFCEGAGLDASLLSTEEPVEIMRRIGGVYRQMVLGVGDLMSERDQARAHYQMTLTTIGSAGNNPFKWAPTQRLAIDLILGGSHGFLSGPAALQSSFRDIKRHLVSTFAGLRGSLRTAIDRCDPARLADVKAGLFQNKAAAQIDELERRHRELVEEVEGRKSGVLDRAFVQAYGAADVAGGEDRP
ncbi:putative component of type VI protein secretion system [Sphingopyxis sp. OAS728]|uniref:type VI secretion system-associated FHA domain protein n=1 Tax=Sphingopyxis sp. OAS728 TaxID=2663823 RepID=UPI0017894E9C|nr:type VI secretion system-associated FHA domain protein [Sphingopyxis sp. OAS728]MBE1529713.1 putative component of type VI protein secretion system [Sphingopyxis sp. OAS728]